MCTWDARLKDVRNMLDLYELHMEYKETDDAMHYLDKISDEIKTMRDLK